MAFRARIVFGSFEKRTPELSHVSGNLRLLRIGARCIHEAPKNCPCYFCEDSSQLTGSSQHCYKHTTQFDFHYFPPVEHGALISLEAHSLDLDDGQYEFQ